jgi:hypothetical protein
MLARFKERHPNGTEPSSFQLSNDVAGLLLAKTRVELVPLGTPRIAQLSADFQLSSPAPSRGRRAQIPTRHIHTQG